MLDSGARDQELLRPTSTVHGIRGGDMRRNVVVVAAGLMTAALALLAISEPQEDNRRVDMVAWSNENDDGRGVLHGSQHGVTRVVSNTCDPDDPACTFHDSPIGYMAAVWTGRTKESNQKHPRFVQVRKDGLAPSSYEDQIGDGVAASIHRSGLYGQFHSRDRPEPHYDLVRLPMQNAEHHMHKFWNLGAVQDVDFREHAPVEAESREIVPGARVGYRYKNADDRYRDRPSSSLGVAPPRVDVHAERMVHVGYGSKPEGGCCAVPPEEEEERKDLMARLRQASTAVATEGQRYSAVASRLAAVRSEGASLTREAEAARAMLLKWSGEEKKIAEKLGEETVECDCGGCCEEAHEGVKAEEGAPVKAGTGVEEEEKEPTVPEAEGEANGAAEAEGGEAGAVEQEGEKEEGEEEEREEEEGVGADAGPAHEEAEAGGAEAQPEGEEQGEKGQEGVEEARPGEEGVEEAGEGAPEEQGVEGEAQAEEPAAQEEGDGGGAEEGEEGGAEEGEEGGAEEGEEGGAEEGEEGGAEEGEEGGAEEGEEGGAEEGAEAGGGEEGAAGGGEAEEEGGAEGEARTEEEGAEGAVGGEEEQEAPGGEPAESAGPAEGGEAEAPDQAADGAAA